MASSAMDCVRSSRRSLSLCSLKPANVVTAATTSATPTDRNGSM